MKKFTKAVSVLVSASVVMSMMSACAFLDKTDKEVTADLEAYVEAVKSNKEKNIKKYIDADEALYLSGMSDEQQAILDAVIDGMEYEITDIDASKKDEEGEATIVFTYVDTNDLFDDGDFTDVDEFIDAMEDADTSEKEIDVDLVLDDDTWLVSDKSHAEVIEFLTSLFENISFSPLNEANCEEFINTFMEELSAGNVQEALDMIDYEKTAIQLYGLDSDEAGDYESNYNSIYGTFFSNSSIDNIVYAIDGDGNYIDVTVEGTVPSNESIAAQFVEDDAAIANFEAGLMAMLLGHSDYLSWIDDYLSTMEGYIPTSDSRTFSVTFSATVDYEGNLAMTGDIEDMLPDWTAMTTYINDNNITLSEERKAVINELALQQLLRDGIITQEQYDQASTGNGISGSIGGSVTVDPDEPTEGAPTSAYNVVRSGDCFRVNFLDENGNEVTEYTSDSKSIVIEVQTFSYYDAGTELSYDVSIAGQGTNTYTAEFLGQTGARVDKVTIEIDPVEVGFYTVTVHEVDSSVVMATIEIYVNK